MSTRCQIGFYESEVKPLKNWDALIYRHCDGYPDEKCGVLATIGPILQEFHKERGLDDTEYASAWLVAKLKTDFINIGISNGLHGDIEFYYAVSPTAIRVYRTGGFGKVDFKNMTEMPELRYEFKEK